MFQSSLSFSAVARMYRNATGIAFAALVSLVLLPAAHAQTSFAATAVGQSTTAQSVTVRVTGTTGAVAAIEVLTSGAPNLDYAESGTDNCLGVAAGSSCSVPVVFSPKYPGARNGAVVLLDANRNVVGTTYLSGIGQGALGVMSPGSIAVAAGQVGEWTQLGDNGPATFADLYLPSGVAVDGLGDIFIADSHHNRVREVSAVNGKIQTVAGDGNAGYDSTATLATNTSLNVPGGIAVDGAGNLLIADTNNNLIREVNLANGSIVTVAGTGQPGYTGDSGLATSATLNSPQGITVDPAGNLYIADTGNNVIRRIDAATHAITTVVGFYPGTPGSTGDSGAATAALLDAPYGVAFDSAGNMYIPDSGNNRIRKVDTSGQITNYAGNGTPAYLGDGGAATDAELYSPLGVACDPAGNVYIADARNYVIRKVNAATGIIGTIAGNNNNPTYSDGKSGYTYGNDQSGEKFAGGGIAAGAPISVTGAGIYAPYAIAVDASGNLLIAEYFDHIVREVFANSSTLFYSPQYWQNQVSGSQAQKLENDGNASLTFSSVTHDANSAFDTGSTTCSTSFAIAVDAQCTVAAEYAPTATTNPAPNPLVGNISLATPASATPYTVQLVGQELLQNQVSVNLTASPNPGSYGSTVKFSVSVTCGSCTHGTPTGTVTFYDGTTPLGTAQTLNGSGDATLQLSNLTVGTHSITANYGGNTYYGAATSNPVTQTIQEQITITVVSSSPSSVLGAPVAFTATVNVSGGIPVTGSVTFYADGAYLGPGALNASGMASYSTAGLPVGNSSITASYTDTNGVSATSTPITQQVQQQTATTLSSSADPSIHGVSVTLTANVNATGSVATTGTVTFYDAGAPIGTGKLAATGATTAAAALQISSLAAGTHSITATYSGDADNLGSTAPAFSQTVNIASTSTSLVAGANPLIAGTKLTLTAAVTTNGGVAVGSVNFYSGSTLLGTASLNASGAAVFSTSSLAVGSYSLTAAYQGNSNNNPSTSSAIPLSVIQATTGVALTSSAPSITVTRSLTLTASITGNGGVPTGSIIFKDGANTLGSVALNSHGVAAFTTSSLGLGTHSLTATYTGDVDDAGSTSATLTENVAAFATQTMLAASASKLDTDQQLTLLTTTSSSSGQSVTGTLTFMNGATSLGSTTISPAGSGTFTLSLQSGTYSITAQYSGDAINGPSTSSPVSVTVSEATEFTIQLNPTSVSIPTSKYANISIDLASFNGFSDQVALGCGSLPSSVTCNFANNDVSLSANGTASVQLTVDTNSPLASGAQAKNEMPNGGDRILAACLFPGAACFGLAFWRFRKRAAVLRLLMVVAMLAGTTFLMTGCGGFSLNSAQPGSYVVQVTATGVKTGVTHVANLTVQVTQ